MTRDAVPHGPTSPLGDEQPRPGARGYAGRQIAAEGRATDAALCGYAVVDKDGNEEPCNRAATGWRWYQDCDHEDALDVACDRHANEGGRRIAALLKLSRAACREILIHRVFAQHGSRQFCDDCLYVRCLHCDDWSPNGDDHSCPCPLNDADCESHAMSEWVAAR